MMFRKKLFINIIALFLVFVFSFGMIACNNEGNNGANNTGGGNETIENEKFNDTGDYIVKDSSSDYRIVTPNVVDSYLSKAVEELTDFFELSTGIKLYAVKESEVDYSAQSKFIVLGETEFAKDKGITVETDKTKTTGYKLKTIDKSIFIQGGTSQGTLYGVYDFLNAIIDFKVFAADEIYFEENVKEIPLKKYDVTFKPTIENRQPYYGNVLTNGNYAMRMKNILAADLWVKINGNFVHTFDYLVPKATYRADHPEWFSKDGTQLCLSEGLRNEEMFDVLYTNLKKFINSTPVAKYVSVSQNDIATWCTCDDCVASKQRYGSNLAVQIKFVNEVAKRVKQDYPDRELYVQTFSYHETVAAITDHFDEVMCEPNVAVMFAPIRANFTAGFTDKSNESTLAALRAISRVCSHVIVWTYDVHFPQFFCLYNTFNGRQDRYREMEKNNVAFVMDESFANQSVNSSFSVLKIFLTSNLTYNNNLSQKALTEEFFEHYFKAASVPMKRFFDGLNAWTLYASKELGMTKDCNNGVMLASKCWPKGVLLGFMEDIDEAYAAIEYLKYTDIELYQKLHDRITIEALAIRYILIELYSSLYSPQEVVQQKTMFKSDASHLKLSYYTSGASLNKLYANWGI